MCIFVDGVVYQGETGFITIIGNKELVDCCRTENASRLLFSGAASDIFLANWKGKSEYACLR